MKPIAIRFSFRSAELVELWRTAKHGIKRTWIYHTKRRHLPGLIFDAAAIFRECHQYRRIQYLFKFKWITRAWCWWEHWHFVRNLPRFFLINKKFSYFTKWTKLWNIIPWNHTTNNRIVFSIYSQVRASGREVMRVNIPTTYTSDKK